MEAAAAAGLFWFGAFTLPLFWLWVIFIAWIVLAIADIHYERPGWATFWLVVFIAILHLGGVVDVVKLVWENPAWLAGGVLGYIGVGLIWTIIKFKARLRKIRIEINTEYMPSLRRRFLDHHKVAGDTVPANLRDDWLAFQDEDYGFTQRTRSMEVGANKGRLALWAIWWPFSMVWTLISDWVTELFNYLIFDVLGTFLKKMVDRERAKIDRG